MVTKLVVKQAGAAQSAADGKEMAPVSAPAPGTDLGRAASGLGAGHDFTHRDFSRDGERAASSRFNKAMVWVLIVIAALAPMPNGGNTSLAWMFWAVVVGAALLLFVIKSRQQRALLVIDGFLPLIALGMIPPIWGMIQILPIGGGWLSFPIALPTGMMPGTISLAPEATALAALRITMYVLLFLLTVLVVARASMGERVLYWVFFGLVLHAVWGMLNLSLLGDISLFGEKTTYFGSATGPFINRNSFASYLGMGLVLGVALLMDRDNLAQMRTPHIRPMLSPSNLKRFALALCILLVFMTLIATESRAGLLASLTGVAVTVAVMMRLRPKPADRSESSISIKIYIALAVIAVLVLIYALGQGVLERGLFTSVDSVSRLRIYQNSLALIMDRPLVGYGLDSFPLAYELGRPDGDMDGFIYNDAHSTYLENWVDGGLIVGSAMIMAAILYLSRLRAVAAQPDQRPAPVAVAAGAITVAAVHSLVDFSFEMAANVMVLVILLGTAIAPVRTRLRSA